jgi:hypothetical protein
MSVLNSILINHARIDVFDTVVAVVYERVKGRPTDSIFNDFCSYSLVGSAKLVQKRPIYCRSVAFSHATPYIKLDRLTTNQSVFH